MRHSARDWRSAISAPLTYRIGSSTLHFRSHLLLAVSLVTAALFTITYLTLTGRNSSNFDHSFVKEHSLATKYNSTYPFTPPERVGGSTRYRIAIVEDPDKGSRIEQEDKWQSRLKYGYLTISDPPTLSASVSWDKDEVRICFILSKNWRLLKTWAFGPAVRDINAVALILGGLLPPPHIYESICLRFLMLKLTEIEIIFLCVKFLNFQTLHILSVVVSFLQTPLPPYVTVCQQLPNPPSSLSR